MLRFHELAPSPNNTKIRMALRFKGIGFDPFQVDPSDRAELLRVSGQELSPVIEDRGIVLNDSEAILAYLDANYSETPRLFPRYRAGRRECEAWKRKIDEEVFPDWLPGFLYAIKRRDDLDEEARGRFQETLASLDDELGDRSSFKDDPEMAICDLRVAQVATYAFPGDGLVARVRLFRRFAEVFGMKPGSLPRLEKFLEPWNDRLR